MLNLDGSTTEDGDHIGEKGAIRLAKALWWMLARIAGWDPTISRMNIDQEIRDFKVGTATEQDVKDMIEIYMESPL